MSAIFRQARRAQLVGKALFKEAIVGLGNGLTLGTMGALVVDIPEKESEAPGDGMPAGMGGMM